MQVLKTSTEIRVPSVTAAQMAELDRIAVEDFSIDLLQMMENAGHRLARMALDNHESPPGKVTVLAGGGGNGGGGLAAARHLLNRGAQVSVVLDRSLGDVHGAAGRQLRTLRAMGVEPVPADQAPVALSDASVTIDALIGYGLRGPATGTTAELIRACNRFSRNILSLDVPSGLDATSGEAPGDVVRPNRILTLALPKTGLSDPDVDLSELYLADIGIPPEAIERLDLEFAWPFGWGDVVRLHCVNAGSRRCREQPRG